MARPKSEGFVRRKEAKKRATRKSGTYVRTPSARTPEQKAEVRKDAREVKEAAKYPRDPGARKKLSGEAKKRAERTATRAGKAETALFAAAQRRKALAKLFTGERRLNYGHENQKGDIRDVTTDTTKERKDVRDAYASSHKNDKSYLKQVTDTINDIGKVGQFGGLPRAFAQDVIKNVVSRKVKDAVKSNNENPTKGKQFALAGAPSVKSASVMGDINKALKNTVESASNVMDLTARPSYGISSATGAALKGDDVAEGAWKGVSGKNKGGFTKVLKDQGVADGTVGNVIGTVADIALDPTTYVSFGAAPVARNAGQRAARKAYKEIAEEGVEAVAKKHGVAYVSSSPKGREAVVKLIKRKAEVAATAKHGTKKRLTVGMNTKGRNGVRYDGQHNAKVSKAFGWLNPATKFRESKVGDGLGRTFAHDWRRKGVATNQQRVGRDAMNKFLGETNTGTAKAGRLQASVDNAKLTKQDTYDFERGLDTPATRGLDKIQADDLARKLEAGTLKKGWEVGSLTQSFRDQIDDLYNAPLSLTKKGSVAQRHAESAEALAKLKDEAAGKRLTLAQLDDKVEQLSREWEKTDGGLGPAKQIGNGPALKPSSTNPYNDLKKLVALMREATHKQNKLPSETYLDEFADGKLGKIKLKDEDVKMVREAFGEYVTPYERARSAAARAEQEYSALNTQLDTIKATKHTKQADEDWEQYVDRLLTQTKWSNPDLHNLAKTIKNEQELGPRKYLKHVSPHEIKPRDMEDPNAFVPSAGSTTASRERVREIMASIENAKPGMFEDDLRNILPAQEVQTSLNTGLANMWDEIATGAGRKVKPGENLAETLGEHEAVYRIGSEHPGRISPPIGKENVSDLAKAADDPADYVVLPKPLVDYVRGQIGPSYLLRTGKGFEQASGQWKGAVTKLNIPSHHITNQIGDFWFSAQANTRFSKGAWRAGKVQKAVIQRNAWERSGKQFKDDLRPEVLDKPMKVGNIEQTLGEWADEMEALDIPSQGFFGHEIPELTRRDTKLNRFFAGREDFLRRATYLEARGRGLTPEDAAAHTSKHHIAYDDLTQFEKGLRSLPVPFITFFARNTRIQISQLFQRPGKFATATKLLNAAARESGYEDYEDFVDRLKDYQKNELLVPLGKTAKPLNLNLPAQTGFDLLSAFGGDLAEAGRAVFAQITPFLKAPIELGFNELGYNGQEIQRTDRYTGAVVDQGLVPAPGYAQTLHIGKKYIPKGETKAIYGWPAKATYLANQLPQTAMVNRAGAPTAQGGKSWTDTIAAQFGWKTQSAPSEENITKEKSYAKKDKLAQDAADAASKYGKDSAQAKAARRKMYQERAKNTPKKAATPKKSPGYSGGGYSGGGYSGYTGGGYR